MEPVVLYLDKKDCCGCGVCMNICPKKAITMKEDEYGFLYPVINQDVCIRCGLCKKVCGYQSREFIGEPETTYVAQSKNSDINKSASGGVFVSIARSVLLMGGVVYGVSMEYIDGRLEPMHIAVEKIDELIKLQGSKYVQSRIGTIYSDVKEQLTSDRVVLFSGTPCQVDGLRNFLRKSYDNLYCIDIICHGVPSSKMFQDYILTLENKYKDKIIDFKFRDKTLGWGLTANAYTANAGNKIIPCYSSSYYDMFLKSYTYRINCYSCKYANKHRVGDVTIGDYWEVEKEHPEILIKNGGEINEKLGVSCIIVNNNQGSKLVEKYGKELFIKKSRYEKVARYNKQLNLPSSLDEARREQVLNAYKIGGYQAVETQYRKLLGWKQVLKNKIKEILSQQAKCMIKKIIR